MRLTFGMRDEVLYKMRTQLDQDISELIQKYPDPAEALKKGGQDIFLKKEAISWFEEDTKCLYGDLEYPEELYNSPDGGLQKVARALKWSVDADDINRYMYDYMCDLLREEG